MMTVVPHDDDPIFLFFFAKPIQRFGFTAPEPHKVCSPTTPKKLGDDYLVVVSGRKAPEQALGPPKPNGSKPPTAESTTQ